MDTTSYQVEHELRALKSDSFHTKAFLASNEITQFFLNIFMNKFLQYYYFICETLNSSQSNRQLQLKRINTIFYSSMHVVLNYIVIQIKSLHYHQKFNNV